MTKPTEKTGETPISPPEHSVAPTDPTLLKQLAVPPISHDHLIKEARSIYAAMLMVEKKCSEVDTKEFEAVQSGEREPKSIDTNRYQVGFFPSNFRLACLSLLIELTLYFKAYVVLHRTLLYEQYDFFLACFHPAASPSLRGLPTKYSMAGRLWKTGIHTFLEILRHHLPDSLEHMLAFLNLAYGVAALLYETIPAHTATWIECLGDLARYRMAIEDKDVETRDVWMDRAKGMSLNSECLRVVYADFVKAGMDLLPTAFPPWAGFTITQQS